VSPRDGDAADFAARLREFPNIVGDSTQSPGVEPQDIVPAQCFESSSVPEMMLATRLADARILAATT